MNRVELSGAPSANDATANTTSAKKKKSHPVQPGSTVSSTQHSDGDDLSVDSGDESKRPRGSTSSLSKSSAQASRHKSFKKPVNSVGKRKAEDIEDDEDNDVESSDDDDENDFEDSSASKPASKVFKKRSNGTEKNKKPIQPGPNVRKLPFKPDHHGKEKRNRKPGKAGVAGGHDTDGDDMFHYDSEECSARPCKQPQDVAIDWIQCDKCTKWYHQVCVGIKPSDANVDTYYCPACKK